MKAGRRRSSRRSPTPESLDAELRVILGKAPAPRLSTGFEARLAARIATPEAVPERASRRRGLRELLPLYWLLAAGAAHWILVSVEWTAVPRPGVWYVMTAALSLLLPSVALAWGTRGALR